MKLYWLLKGLREEKFEGCFQQWKRRWDSVLSLENNIFINTLHELFGQTGYMRTEGGWAKGVGWEGVSGAVVKILMN